MEICSFSLGASIHLSAYLQLCLRSDVRFVKFDDSVSKRRRRPWLLASLDYEAQSRRLDDHLPRQAMEDHGRTVRQCLESVSRSIFFPAQPSFYYRRVERRRARGLDTASERLYTKATGPR